MIFSSVITDSFPQIFLNDMQIFIFALRSNQKKDSQSILKSDFVFSWLDPPNPYMSSLSD